MVVKNTDMKYSKSNQASYTVDIPHHLCNFHTAYIFSLHLSSLFITTVIGEHRILSSVSESWYLYCELKSITASFDWSTSGTSEMGIRKCTLFTDSYPAIAQQIWVTYFQSSTLLRSVQWCDHIVMTFRPLGLLFELIYFTWFILIL